MAGMAWSLLLPGKPSAAMSKAFQDRECRRREKKKTMIFSCWMQHDSVLCLEEVKTRRTTNDQQQGVKTKVENVFSLFNYMFTEDNEEKMWKGQLWSLQFWPKERKNSHEVNIIYLFATSFRDSENSTEHRESPLSQPGYTIYRHHKMVRDTHQPDWSGAKPKGKTQMFH